MKRAMVVLACALWALQAQAVEISFEQDQSLPIVYLNAAIKTGAVADPADALGLTNFTGEMLLRGTEQRTKEQLNLALDQMGAQLMVETRSEATILRGAVLSSQLGSFLSLLQEVLTQPNFPEAEIANLKSEVQSQILEELGSDQKLTGLEFTSFLFGSHPYGKPILGKLKTVKAFTRDQVVAHYHNFVTDDLLLIVGSGDAQESLVTGWANSLSKLLPHGSELARVPEPRNSPEKRLLLVDKPNRTQTQITGGQIGVQMTDPRFFPLFLGNDVFGGESFSARLMVEIRVKRGWSYGAYSYFKHSRQPRSWQFYLFPAEKDTPAALAMTLKLVNDLKENGITPEEFEFSQRRLVNNSGFMYNTPKKRVENKLTEKTLHLPDGFMKSYGPRLSEVKLEDVNRSLKEFLHPDKFSIVVLGTAKQLKAKLAKAVGILASKIEVVPYNKE